MEEYAKSSSEEDEDESVDDIEGTIVSRTTIPNKKMNLFRILSKGNGWIERARVSRTLIVYI